MSGIIEILNPKNNFGFIRSSEAGKKMIFFNREGMVKKDFSKLKIGDSVDFEMDESSGRRATKISKTVYRSI